MGTSDVAWLNPPFIGVPLITNNGSDSLIKEDLPRIVTLALLP
jgi:hypothetical protein